MSLDQAIGLPEIVPPTEDRKLGAAAIKVLLRSGDVELEVQIHKP